MQMPEDHLDDKSAWDSVIHVMAWFRQTGSDYMSQCWPSYMTSLMASLCIFDLINWITCIRVDIMLYFPLMRVYNNVTGLHMAHRLTENNAFESYPLLKLIFHRKLGDVSYFFGLKWKKKNNNVWGYPGDIYLNNQPLSIICLPKCNVNVSTQRMYKQCKTKNSLPIRGLIMWSH